MVCYSCRSLSYVKDPSVEEAGNSKGLSFVSWEQWLQIASTSLPDKQFKKEHDRYASKDTSLKLALPVMCTTASWKRGLLPCGLWMIQTNGLWSKLSCAVTPSNANQLCSRKAISMSACTWKLSDLNKGFFKVKRIILKDWSLSVSWRDGQNGLQSAVRRWDNVQQAFFFITTSPERNMSAYKVHFCLNSPTSCFTSNAQCCCIFQWLKKENTFQSMLFWV